MSILLSVQGLGATFGARPLFEGVNFTVEDGDRIGLIGPNGTGKSTLLRLVADVAGEHTQSGLVSRRRGLRVGFLQQVPEFAADETVGAALQSAAASGGEASAEHGTENWEGARAAERLMDELALDAATPISRLSGGWQKRVALARELARQPDLLLLDEPTNHLDVESIEWLERLLAHSRFATITVTHDRFFLRCDADPGARSAQRRRPAGGGRRL